MKSKITIIILFTYFIYYSSLAQEQQYELQNSPSLSMRNPRFNISSNLSLGGGSSEMSWIIDEKAPGLEQSGTIGRTYRSNLSDVTLDIKFTYAYRNIYLGALAGLTRLKSSNDESIYLNDNNVVTQRIDEDQLFPKSRTFYGFVMGYDIPLKKNVMYISPEYNYILYSLGPKRAFFRNDQFSDDTQSYNEIFENRTINKFALYLKLKAKSNSFFTVGFHYQVIDYNFSDSYLKESFSNFELDEKVMSLSIGYQIII